ncbi:MAG TPA: hypothetical protein VFG88_13335 [Nocardioidaceae bacterium]|jgi:ATP synthase protein I|nr:hypothetical protein [Nocardioidaceae bacterium]
MTTAQPRSRPGYPTTTVGSVIRGAAVAAGGVGLLAVLLGAALAGSAAALGALLGTVIVLAFFAAGAAVVGVAAALAPATSLLVALLTYTLKVVLVGLVFLGLTRSGALGSDLDPQWLAGALIACTLTWTAAQVVLSMRARQPAYDLPGPAAPEEEASVR